MLLFSLINSPLQFLVFIIAILGSLTIHEFSHAYVANQLGDPTAKNMGRLTLNPIAHLDLWGTIFLLLAGFGWGKPVMVDSRNFPNPVLDNITVSFAGPMSNLALAIIFGLLLRFLPMPIFLQNVVMIVVFYNLVFMIFNLIPIPPLDGSKVLGLFLSQETIIVLSQYGMLILFALVIFSSWIPVIPYILNHVVGFFFQLITGQTISI